MQLNTETSNELFNHFAILQFICGKPRFRFIIPAFLPCEKLGIGYKGLQESDPEKATHHSFFDFLWLSLSWLVTEPEDTLFYDTPLKFGNSLIFWGLVFKIYQAGQEQLWSKANFA